MSKHKNIMIIIIILLALLIVTSTILYFTYKKYIYIELTVSLLGIINIINGNLLLKSNKNLGISLIVSGIVILVFTLAAIFVGLSQG